MDLLLIFMGIYLLSEDHGFCGFMCLLYGLGAF